MSEYKPRSSGEVLNLHQGFGFKMLFLCQGFSTSKWHAPTQFGGFFSSLYLHEVTKQASLHLLQCFGLGETSKIANGTAGVSSSNECIVHIGRAERLGWWEKVIQENIPGCETLEDFALLEPTLETIQNLSLSLSALVSNDRLKNVQSVSADKQDKQYENTIRRSQYFLLYEETAHAIRSGDVGRVETCLRDWIPIFKAVG